MNAPSIETLFARKFDRALFETSFLNRGDFKIRLKIPSKPELWAFKLDAAECYSDHVVCDDILEGKRVLKKAALSLAGSKTQLLDYCFLNRREI